MPDRSYLDWPFFEPRHRELAAKAEAWTKENVHEAHGRTIEEVDAACRELVRSLGEGGWLRHMVGEAGAAIDTRAVCLLRQTLAYRSGLADFALAMQGLGSGPISLFGSLRQKQRYLPRVAQGEALAAFALSETDAGSDVAALACAARADGGDYVLDGEKTWISNGGIADFYVVFARTGDAESEGRSSVSPALDRSAGGASELALRAQTASAPSSNDTSATVAKPSHDRVSKGSRGISAFIVDAGTPGFEIAERIEVIAPHPLARLRFDGCRLPASQLLGEPGQGFKIAMATLDVFRTSVAAAALGFGRRALDEALARATGRKIFGGTLADLQLTQAKIAEMATGLDAAALLTYRAAWLRDGGTRVTREAAMAKMTATETAQRVIDAAVQIHGGLGVVSEHPVERLYREIRALRIYEGATEVQQLIIAREELRTFAERQSAE